MAFIECYSEYLKFEKIVRGCIDFVNFAFLPEKLRSGYEKFIGPVVLIYYCMAAASSLLMGHENLTGTIMSLIGFFGGCQIFVKYVTVIFNVEELNELIFWITQQHGVSNEDFITKSLTIELKRILTITKIGITYVKKKILVFRRKLFLNKISFHRLIFASTFLATIGMYCYCIYADIVVYGVPGLPIIPNESHLTHHIHQAFVLFSTSFILIVPDAVLITIGFYMIAIFNIFRTMLKQLDTSFENRSQVLKLIYIFHRDVIKKVHMFNDVFYFTFVIQTATSLIFTMVIFFLVWNEKSLALLPLSLGIFAQFSALCIFGEILFAKTENFFVDLYLTKWYEFSISDQKVFLMMMYMTQKPFGLKAAGMYDINLIMFIQVCKAGISFIAILYSFT